MYFYETIEDIIRISEREGISFGRVVLKAELAQTGTEEEYVIGEIINRLKIFRQSARAGVENKKKTKSGMSGGQAAQILEQKNRLLGILPYKAMAYALAISEANAGMSKIVACPTAGSCGIMPGCLLAVEEEKEISSCEMIEAFLVGAGIGNVVTAKACVAGAVGGCQAECGTAAAMAAGAVVAALEGSARQIGNAAALAMKNVLGLVCDPVAGLVEVPCVKRNGIHAVHSLTAAEMALCGLESQIPVDEVIAAMYEIGKAMPHTLRETSEGGLAKTETGKAIYDKVRNL